MNIQDPNENVCTGDNCELKDHQQNDTPETDHEVNVVTESSTSDDDFDPDDEANPQNDGLDIEPEDENADEDGLEKEPDDEDE